MIWRICKSRKIGRRKTKPWLVQGGLYRRTVNLFFRWKTIREFDFWTKGEAIEKMEKLNLREAQKMSFAKRGKQDD